MVVHMTKRISIEFSTVITLDRKDPMYESCYFST